MKACDECTIGSFYDLSTYNEKTGDADGIDLAYCEFTTPECTVPANDRKVNSHL
jgi:hypothetical protein